MEKKIRTMISLLKIKNVEQSCSSHQVSPVYQNLQSFNIWIILPVLQGKKFHGPIPLNESFIWLQKVQNFLPCSFLIHSPHDMFLPFNNCSDTLTKNKNQILINIIDKIYIFKASKCNTLYLI